MSHDDKPAAPAADRNLEGALWMVASAVAFTAMTTLIKYLGDDYPASLQTFYRQLAGFIILLPIILKRRRAAFATTRPGILIFRSAAGTLGMILGGPCAKLAAWFSNFVAWLLTRK